MKKGSAVILGMLVIAGAAGCSSQQASFQPRPGALPPGTAQLTISGTAAFATETVQCETTDHLTTIKIGNEPSVATAMVSNAGQLTAEWVRLHDLNGFTGTYSHGLGPSAQVTIVGSTYHISGSADGTNIGNPSSPKAERFEIKVSC